MALRILPFTQADLPAARSTHRRAFSRFLGLPAEKFRAGADCLGPRWRMWRDGGIAAWQADRLVGGGLLTDWGSACVLGPVWVDPDAWGAGIARALMAELIGIIDRRGFAWTGLFTHPQSPKHIRLYEAFGFGMQRITAVMSRPVTEPERGPQPALFANQPAAAQERTLSAVRKIGDAVMPGLDWRAEIRSIDDEGLGDTLLAFDGENLDGFACVHHGTGSEASAGDYFVKVAAVRPGDDAAARFARLLDAVDATAGPAGARRVVAGTNVGRAGAYRVLRDRGFRTDMNGIAMFRPATDGYNADRSFVIDDWR